MKNVRRKVIKSDRTGEMQTRDTTLSILACRRVTRIYVLVCKLQNDRLYVGLLLSAARKMLQ